MKKLGKFVWRLYLAFMVVLLLGFIATFIGTPWGYLDFYVRANRHLDRYFGDAAQVTGISYDFKLKRYLGSAEYDGIPGDTFALRLDHRSEEPLMYNYYHLLLWERELMARYQPAYPDFTLNFDLPVSGSPYVSPRAPEDYPSIFALESPGDFLKWIIITLPSDAAPERLFALVMELDAAFPQTDITIWQNDQLVHLDWRDRNSREDYDIFLNLLTEKFSN